MFKSKNKHRTKTKMIQVKSTALIGKSQMEKVTEKMTSEGWDLVGQQEVAKNKYLLQFEYEMSQEEIARADRNKIIRNLVIGLFAFACYGLMYMQGAATNRQNEAGTSTAAAIAATDDAHATQTATLWTLTPTFTPSLTPTITYTPSITPTATITPSPTITDTPAPTDTDSPTNTPRPTSTSRPTSLPSGTTYYSEGNAVNVRTCPQLDCEVADVLGFAEEIEITDTRVDGDAVNGDTRWMEGVINGDLVYVHSSLVSRTRPQVVTAVPQSNTSSTTGNTSGTGTNNTRRPANCDEAVAMGLTAEQAAQWDHLDRDGDGVACYGD